MDSQCHCSHLLPRTELRARRAARPSAYLAADRGEGYASSLKGAVKGYPGRLKIIPDRGVSQIDVSAASYGDRPETIIPFLDVADHRTFRSRRTKKPPVFFICTFRAASYIILHYTAFGSTIAISYHLVI